MTESKRPPGRQAPASDTTRDTHWLVRAKLLAPIQFVPLIDRSGLLPTGYGCLPRLISVQAPAGFGKSTLLVQWRTRLEAEGVVTSWLSLEEAESDPSQFLIYLAHGLHHAGVDVSATGLIGASAASKEDRENALRALVACVLSEERKVVAILDDFEHVDGTPASTILERLLAIMPPNMHLAIASRRRPKLKISRLRAQGQICEISARELRLSATDASEMLGSAFSRSGIRILLDKTEGWPAALQLARHMITDRGAEEASALVAIAGKADEVGEYVAEQVLAGLPEETRQFLRDTAPFVRFDAVIADYLRERNDSARILATLGDLNPLVASLGEAGPAYRLHPIVAEHLHVDLAIHDPARLRHLFARAARWHYEYGSIVEAMQYAAKAEQPELAKGFVEAAGGVHIILREGMARARMAFRHVPANVIAGAPRVALVKAVLLLTEGKYHQARREYERVRIMTQNLPVDSAGGDLHALEVESRIVGLYFSVHGDFVATDEILASHEALAREEVRENPGVLFFFTLFNCLVYQQRGELDRAERALREFETVSRLNSLPYGQVFVHIYEGMIAFARGGLTLAEMHFKRGQRVVQERFEGDEGLTGMMVNTMLAEVEFERNEVERARAHLAAAWRSIEHAEGWFDIFAAGHGIAAKLAYVSEGLEAAMGELDRLEKVADERELERVRTLVNAWRVGMLLRADDLDAAVELARRAGLHEIWPSNPDNPLPTWRERDAVGEAVWLLALHSDRLAEGRVLVDRLLADATEGGRAGARAKAMIMRARLHQEGGETDAAARSLIAALNFAGGERAMRPFLDEGEPVAMLIELCMRDYREDMSEAGRAHAGALFDAFRRERESAGGVHLFTRRQRQILLELGREQSNKEIARALELSEDAVKYHLKKIFSALGVERRKQAIAEARRQSLIP